MYGVRTSRIQVASHTESTVDMVDPSQGLQDSSLMLPPHCCCSQMSHQNSVLRAPIAQPRIHLHTQTVLRSFHGRAGPLALSSTNGMPVTANPTHAFIADTQQPGSQQSHYQPATPQGSKYLSYSEYVTMQQQLQQQQAEAASMGQQADETAHASTSSPSRDSTGKRVAWNKGRKHSPLTIARITEGTARALQRPEVKAKLDAWNQSRVGSKMDSTIKARISERQRAAMAAKFENMAPEQLAAHRAKRSAIAKRLWQDPEYAARTVSAIRAAGGRRRKSNDSGQAADSAAGGDGTSSSSSSRSSAAKRRSSSGSSGRGAAASSRTRSRAAGTGSSSLEQGLDAGDGSAAAAAASKPQRPTQKERAALEAMQREHEREQLQQQVTGLLQTLQLMATTEQTVLQLQRNMPAFQNNPQARATAAQALQQAQDHLAPAKQLVARLQESLDKHGVQWDPSTGLITHIHHKPLEDTARKPRTNSSSSSKAPGVRSSSSSKAGSSKRAAAAAAAAELGDDPSLVRSSRRAGQVLQQSNVPAQDLVVSSRRRAAAAEAAAGGGRRNSPGSSGSWTAVGVGGSHTQASGSGVPVNGNGLSNGNGNGKNGHGSSSSIGGQFVPLQPQTPLGSSDQDDDASDW